MGEEPKRDEDSARAVGRKELLHRKPPPCMRVILDESVLRCPVADENVWVEQLNQLVYSAAQPSITLQVLPLSAGFHALRGCGSLSLLWQTNSTLVAYIEGISSGELLEEADDLHKYRLAYDQVRDLALSPSDSVAFIASVLEDFPS